MQVLFALLIGAISIGQAGPNLEKLVTAAGASISIYDIIDRVRAAKPLLGDSAVAQSQHCKTMIARELNIAWNGNVRLVSNPCEAYSIIYGLLSWTLSHNVTSP